MHGIHAQSRTYAAATAAPVDGRRPAEPVDLGVLHGLVTRWLREQRHGNPAAVCWVCPRDAAGLVARVEAARVAGLL